MSGPGGGQGPSLLARYTTQPAGTTFVFSPSHGQVDVEARSVAASAGPSQPSRAAGGKPRSASAGRAVGGGGKLAGRPAGKPTGQVMPAKRATAAPQQQQVVGAQAQRHGAPPSRSVASAPSSRGGAAQQRTPAAHTQPQATASLQLAQPSPLYVQPAQYDIITAPEQVAQARAYVSGAAGKPALGDPPKVPRTMAPPVATVTRTWTAAEGHYADPLAQPQTQYVYTQAAAAAKPPRPPPAQPQGRVQSAQPVAAAAGGWAGPSTDALLSAYMQQAPGQSAAQYTYVPPQQPAQPQPGARAAAQDFVFDVPPPAGARAGASTAAAAGGGSRPLAGAGGGGGSSYQEFSFEVPGGGGGYGGVTEVTRVAGGGGGGAGGGAAAARARLAALAAQLGA